MRLLRADVAFPAAVLGPVDFWAFRWLAAIRAAVVAMMRLVVPCEVFPRGRRGPSLTSTIVRTRHFDAEIRKWAKARWGTGEGDWGLGLTSNRHDRERAGFRCGNPKIGLREGGGAGEGGWGTVEEVGDLADRGGHPWPHGQSGVGPEPSRVVFGGEFGRRRAAGVADRGSPPWLRRHSGSGPEPSRGLFGVSLCERMTDK